GIVSRPHDAFGVAARWHVGRLRGPLSYDVKLLYILAGRYEPHFFKNERGILGRLLDGWAFAPLFTARSGFPLQVSVGTGVNQNCQSFGEMNCNEGSTNENAVLFAPYSGGSSAHKGTTVTGSIGKNTNPTDGGAGINMFSDPAAIYSQFRRLILGLDTNGGGAGRIYGLPTWNLDLSVSQKFRISERSGIDILAHLANVLIHFHPNNPTLNRDSRQSWGVINSALPNTNPRQIELGLRFHF